MKNAKTFSYAILMLCCIPLLVSCTKVPEKDYGLYKNMQEYLLQKFQVMPGFQLRDIAADFEDYELKLTLIPRLVFGESELEVHLYPGESDHMATACISQFEEPPDSGNFSDVAFVVRPNADIRAPFLHGDALKGMAGMSTSFSMDFYNVNKDEIDVDQFFGEDGIELLQQGLALVQKFQRIPQEDGGNRGKYTPHLDPYKSAYRIEMQVPDTEVEAELKAYHDAALAAFKLFADAYLTALARLQPEDDAALISGTKTNTDIFINTLLEEDTAAKLGLMLFNGEEKFSHYFNDGFWRAGYYGPGL
jgi:hypothetical protein